MNYRHAFHAGNFADVFKHALLARILVYLMRKPAPLRYIDTHAGIGRYDLAGEQASRSGEWRDGIGRLAAASPPPAVASLLAPYLDAIGPIGANGQPRSYPGSPALAQHLLRKDDRLLLCELHGADGAALRSTMARDRRVKVLAVDGYQGLKASVPPLERRGVVLIDPPFEDPAEDKLLAAALADAIRRWPTGTYALWYPIKTEPRAAALLRDLRASGVRHVLETELFREPGPGLRGSGLFVVNPPYTLKAEAEVLLSFLAACFENAGSRWHWRADEVET
jgi:23S rRNA (adenine2030-N6)-methyltransferase